MFSLRTFFAYLGSEGVVETIRKVIHKVTQSQSDTVFLMCDKLTDSFMQDPEISFEPLTSENLPEFEKIKFFQYISGEVFLQDPNLNLILAKIGDEYIGYAAIQFNTLRIIHGLCGFDLCQQDVWYGPAYIKRKYRGRGLNRSFVLYFMNDQKGKGNKRFFTCANADNASCIRSLHRLGFQEIGHIVKTKAGETTIDGTVDFLSRYRD